MSIKRIARELLTKRVLLLPLLMCFSHTLNAEEVTISSASYSTTVDLGAFRSSASSANYSNESSLASIHLPAVTPIIEETQSYETFVANTGSGSGSGGCLLKKEK